MARAQGARAQMALGFESSYGIPPSAGDFWQMPFATSNLGAEQPLLSSELLGYGRDPLPPVKDAITVDGDVVIPIDARYAGIWLKALFGAPTTASGLRAAGRIVFGANPAAASTITLNGTAWTFVASGAAGNQTNIGATLAATLAQLVTDLNASAATEIVKCTYSALGGATLLISFDTAGTSGNSYTLAASAATVSAATLTGGAATGYSHTFASGGWTLPSLAIEIGIPDVPFFGLNTGCVVNQLSWTMQRSGLITAQVNLIAQGEVTGSASVVGALNALPLTRFGAFQGAISREGSQLGNVVSAQVSNSNNLERIEVIRDDGRIEGADPSIAALIGTIEVRFADQTLLDQAVSGAPAEAGTVRNSVWGRAIEHQPARAFRKRSPKRTANCALAIAHSLGGIFHSFSDRFKTRNSNFIAASSVGKCPLARTARRSFEFKASMALVV